MLRLRPIVMSVTLRREWNDLLNACPGSKGENSCIVAKCWAIAAAMGLDPVAGGRFGIPFGRLDALTFDYPR